MQTVLITGANRGIGLELVKQYLARGDRVIAGCRQPAAAAELNALACDALEIHALDVAETASITGFCQQLTPGSIHCFINNAGVYGPRAPALEDITMDEWLEVFRVNTVAPLILTAQLLPALTAGARLAYISSKMGSITDNSSGGGYVYRSSKTALNQVVKSLSHDLGAQGYKVAAFHPGWVRTDMGGPNAMIDVQTSAQGLVRAIEGLESSGHGDFINYDGSRIPW